MPREWGAGRGRFRDHSDHQSARPAGEWPIKGATAKVGNDFGDVVRKALSTKLPKLTKQKADKRVLILERRHMNLVPEQILDEIRNQRPSFPKLAAVDEIWILETIGYEPGGHFLFELSDDKYEHLATLTFHNGVWTSRSGKDGIPICNN